MPKQNVFCIATSEAQAMSIVDSLEAAGFSSSDISALFADKTGIRDIAHTNETKAPEKAAAGLGAGAVLGGTLGWLTSLGALAIPGVGALVAVGPIAAILSGAVLGSAIGGITGALIGMGIPEHEATHYERKVKGGEILISVLAEDSDETDLAKEIFKQEDAEDIAVTSESTGTKENALSEFSHECSARSSVSNG